MNTRLSNASYINLYETIKELNSPHSVVSESSEADQQLEQEIIMDCVNWLMGKTDEEIEMFVTIAETFLCDSDSDLEAQLTEAGSAQAKKKNTVGMKIWKTIERVGIAGGGILGAVGAMKGAKAFGFGGKTGATVAALTGAIGGMMLANKAFSDTAKLMKNSSENKAKALATKLARQIKKENPGKVKAAATAVKAAVAKKAGGEKKSEPKTDSPKKSDSGGGSGKEGEWGGKRRNAGRPVGS
jgi:hypothetical protein